MKTFAIQTLGCKVNTYESEAVARLFEAHDYHKVNFKEVADVYVINTCTVTNSGDSKSRRMIRRAVRNNPNAIVCVMGCYSQVAPDEIKAIDGVDIILGTQYRHQIVDLVESYEKKQTDQLLKITNVMKEKEFEELDVQVFTENTRAFLKIQDGCNNFCTYCIIPYARGLVRSRFKDSVLSQAQALVNNGFVEIVLTGIHTGAYGVDLEDYSFYDLLVDLTKIDGLKRLRISSIEINQVSNQIIELIKNNKIIVDHLHVPLQGGSDTLLKRMNRKYTLAEYEDKINSIKNSVPNIALTTDVIVGFPQETEEEFLETIAFIKKIGYSQLHVFPYSKRKNTPAATMEGQVDETVKNERVKTLMDLSKQLHLDYAKRFIGKTISVIFEEELSDGYLTGHSSNYLKVNAIGSPNLIGNEVKVTIEDVNSFGITGTINNEVIL